MECQESPNGAPRVTKGSEGVHNFSYFLFWQSSHGNVFCRHTKKNEASIYTNKSMHIIRILMGLKSHAPSPLAAHVLIEDLLPTPRPTSIDLMRATMPMGKQQQISANKASARKSLGGLGLSFPPATPSVPPLSQMYTMCFPEGWGHRHNGNGTQESLHTNWWNLLPGKHILHTVIRPYTAYLQKRVLVCVHSHTHRHTCTHARAHTHIDTDTHMHAHTQTPNHF